VGRCQAESFPLFEDLIELAAVGDPFQVEGHFVWPTAPGTRQENAPGTPPAGAVAMKEKIRPCPLSCSPSWARSRNLNAHFFVNANGKASASQSSVGPTKAGRRLLGLTRPRPFSSVPKPENQSKPRPRVRHQPGNFVSGPAVRGVIWLLCPWLHDCWGSPQSELAR
jgi:hypothetical protein